MSVNRYNATTDTMEHIAGNEAIILDEVPTEGSNNAVKSGGVFAELANKANLTQITNPNLLDNPWFTVNQRQVSSGTKSWVYLADRWYIGYNPSDSVTFTNTDNIITMTSTANIAILCQRLENLSLSGKQVTLSIMLSNGTVKVGTGIMPTLDGNDVTLYTDDNFYMYLQRKTNNSNGYPLVGIVVKANKTVSFKAVKLELGSVSTLAMDTAPNYATELLKCQRYFLRIKATAASNWMLFCMVWANSSMNYIINTPAEMRLVPTVSVSNIANFIICKGASTNSRKTGTNINCFGKIGNSIMGTINVSETDLALGDMYVIKAGSADDYINFSADL